jgi:hypothetical protein
VIVKLARRTLFSHPIRSAVLAAGFGTGVAVMAILLGVGQVVLEQARAPALVGGGDVVISNPGGGALAAPHLLMSSTLGSGPLADRVRAKSPWRRTTLYLVHDDDVVPVRVRGGIPSLERAVGDDEIAGIDGWVDDPADAAWTSPDPAGVLRSIDRFRPVPDVPARASSWAEWLYFNGRSATARFYLTFLAGPMRPDGLRDAGVRLQLDRGRGLETFNAATALDQGAIAKAPELTILGNSIRLKDLKYTITLDLRDDNGRKASGELVITAALTQLLPPIQIDGAGGWQSGYVVPVMSGSLGGTLIVDGTRVPFDGGVGYHDHNWGFWEGVSWQWGQVQHDDLSIVYGRLFPPADAADPDRIPGFLAAIGPDGPIGHATNVTIDEKDSPGSSRPQQITVRGRSGSLDLTLTFTVESLVANRMQSGPITNAMDFLQLRGQYTVAGRAAERVIDFQAPGSAETFRGRQASPAQ